MKILILHQYFLETDDNGGSRFTEFTNQWSEKGHEITVIAGMMHYTGQKKRPEYQGKWFKKNQQGKVVVWRTHVSEHYNAGFIGRLWAYFTFVFSSLWAGLFKARDKYDVILVTSPPLFVGITAYLLSRAKGIPYVFEVRDLWPESAIDIGVLTNKWVIKLSFWLEAFIYKKATLINVLTPAFYNTLIEKKNVPAKKLIMITNASDFSLSDGLLESFDRGVFRKNNQLEGRFVITYVGAHGLANHLEQVIDAGKALEDTNVLFLLIGEGMEKERLKRLALEKQVTNVTFLDSVTKRKVFEYLLASEMGASVLKRVDTFKTVYSNKTFDYMSCKKPILMAIDGVSRELVEVAKAGTYIEPENIDQFNKVIREYLNDPNRILVEGENGYSYAKNNFNREILAERYLKAIEGLIKND